MRSEMTVLWIVIDHLFSFLLLASQIRAAAGHVRGQLDQRFLREPARRDAAGGDQEEAGSILRRGICPAEEDSGGVNNRMYSAHLYVCMIIFHCYFYLQILIRGLRLNTGLGCSTARFKKTI